MADLRHKRTSISNQSRRLGAIAFEEQELVEWLIVAVAADANVLVSLRRRDLPDYLHQQVLEVMP
jgi:hypothetical protein